MMESDDGFAVDADGSELAANPVDLDMLRAGDHPHPHSVLGSHSLVLRETPGVVVRSYHPDALSCECLLPEEPPRLMKPVGGGLFALFFSNAQWPGPSHRYRFYFPDGNSWECGDPYSFEPSVGNVDLHLINEGTHRRLWEALGAHVREIDGVKGVSFAVWAPNARRVSVVGDFDGWDGRLRPMRALGQSGVFELFVPDVRVGALYKYEIKTRDGLLREKADPLARAMELPPATASAVTETAYRWQDDAWIRARRSYDPLRSPVSIYEVHLGSWARVPEENHRMLTYRELAPRLVKHVKKLGFTHIELLPVAEHAYYPSWGYQVTGYFAPTARYGSPDDLRYFVDHCHQNGIGVIIDWVPAHFPKDDFALRRFDGTALYEHEDMRRGEHPDWGTLIFNYGRSEVRNYLLANALYWIHEFHVDGLRVDAVASMLYLDYSRPSGEWIPNPYGGRENIEAIEFLRLVNDTVRDQFPGVVTIAEESTDWSGVTQTTAHGGLGFTFKWNMGWMHDTLSFFQREPVHRSYHIDQLTFSMMYEHSERFINSISHDEVVHGKRSLVEKMPGDFWQKLANVRLLLAYQFTRPGKQLVFMGTELAQHGEWYQEASLDWHLAEEAPRRALQTYIGALAALYFAHPCLWRTDPDPESFRWIDFRDRENTIVSYLRCEGDAHLVVVLNLTPVPRDDYAIGVPGPGRYAERLSSDGAEFGGSDYPTHKIVEAQPEPEHGYECSLRLNLPPLGALVLSPERQFGDPQLEQRSVSRNAAREPW
jgi:1,4-alpha-glucan branching enzyme